MFLLVNGLKEQLFVIFRHIFSTSVLFCFAYQIFIQCNKKNGLTAINSTDYNKNVCIGRSIQSVYNVQRLCYAAVNCVGNNMAQQIFTVTFWV